jgi:hypothetical protein
MLVVNPFTPELNPPAQRCLSKFFSGILIFKELIARRFYTSFLIVTHPAKIFTGDFNF